MSNVIQKAKRNAYGVAAFLFAATVVLPNFLVGSASAAGQITTRSIELSNSTIGTLAEGQGVTYNLTFKPATTQSDITRIIVDFCAESPLIGHSTCTQPSGMTVGTTNPTASTGTWVGSTLNTGRTLLLSSGSNVTLTAGVDFTVAVEGFTNPGLGAFYSRVLTYRTGNAGDAAAYDEDTVGTYNDAGGIALSTTDDINLTAAVMETLTFCVSAAAPTANCGGTSTPSLVLGTGNPPVLDDGVMDTADAYFQVSTNAGGTTTIKMRNSAVSGGMNSGATNNINPIDHATTPQNIVEGTEAFGVRVMTPVVIGSGTVTPESTYSDNTAAPNEAYNMRVPEVTSNYGDTIATASGPLDDVNVPLEFAATISATTPAGIYTANIALIATSSY